MAIAGMRQIDNLFPIGIRHRGNVPENFDCRFRWNRILIKQCCDLAAMLGRDFVKLVASIKDTMTEPTRPLHEWIGLSQLYMPFDSLLIRRRNARHVRDIAR
jgi:hypothetical protein